MAGFSTRAIRAATRMREVHERPTRIPIHRAATFSADGHGGARPSPA